MRTHKITFEELEISTPHGICLATGSFVVVYHMAPAEPDVGIMSSYVEIDAYHDAEIMLDLINEDGDILRRFDDATLLPKVLREYGEEYILADIENSI